MKTVLAVDEKQYQLFDDEGEIFAWIFFRGDEFCKCDYKFVGPYSRDQWKMLAYIEKQITRIERQLTKKR